jgi:arsenite methyltransferase
VQVNSCGPTSTLQSVQNYYGKVLSTTKDLKTSACTAAGRPHQLIVEALIGIPDEVKEKFYGCGAPLPLGIDGLRVLDLGSGSGRDCYVASKLVGENGNLSKSCALLFDDAKHTVNETRLIFIQASVVIAGFVTGLDMTDEQLDVAKAHIEEYTTKLGYKKPNMAFIKGFIEKLGEAGIPDESVDIIMSNCVVNLSPDKLSVLSEAYRCSIMSPSVL